ncbi:MAG: type I restriction enzyme HsdR N-terminal domain-containing protein [Phocaeicola sp.]|uniref:type I restriction enzyme HsdR N-terminal domain-containing protein n=1 Tax=Phocaeicola TaxID=909656 RepID=UPI00234F581E|nr:type I restriction enzyme HsdR N-terminal domain-containing protein [Phocaeicola oris]MCE2616539.1 type I restriction enzyme HsdR N-terminal domain-containing protein [Phocaeicola oris]
MTSLNLPPTELKIIEKDGKQVVFDVLRKKYVTLTPEEWVRQNFIHYLLEHKNYPKGLLANEIQLELNGTNKRCDSVLFNKNLKAILIIEYKAPNIKITQKVFDQITRYNMVLKVDYLIVSNGINHYCCKINYEKKEYTFLPDIPSYEEL